jgi:hypothetical protein
VGFVVVFLRVRVAKKVMHTVSDQREPLSLSLFFSPSSSLGKIIRSVFPRLKTRRLGPRGKTKHHYHGISISSASKLQVPADAIITGKKAQNRRVRGPDVTASPPKRQRRAHKLMEDGYDRFTLSS